MIEFIGTAAAILTTCSFLPQALMVLRTKDTASISLTMYAMFLTGVAAWFVYGVMIGSWPVIIANAITFLLAAMIFAVKVHNTLAQGARRPTSMPMAS